MSSNLKTFVDKSKKKEVIAVHSTHREKLFPKKCLNIF